MTNGEKMKSVFGLDRNVLKTLNHSYILPIDWWNAEYKEPVIRDNRDKNELNRFENELEPTTKNSLGVDCISREQAIQTIQRYGVGCFDADEFSPEECERFVIGKLNDLPSVTPQEPKIVTIAEIKYDKDKLKELANKAVLTVIPQEPTALPSVTPIRPKGHWIEERNDYGEITHWHCSNCYDDSGFITTCKWDYCPNCGADMREVKE